MTCGDPHERLLLWVIEPDRFVVLTPGGDIYEEMRGTRLSAQIRAGRRHFTIGPASVVAYADLWISMGIRSVPSLTQSLLGLALLSTGAVKRKPWYPWSCGRRASVRREILPVVTSEDIALDRNPREDCACSGNERTEVATDRVDFSLGGGCVWVVCDPEDRS